LRYASLAFFLFGEFQCDFGINVTTVVAGGVRKFGRTAFFADRIIYRRELFMAATCSGSALTCLFCWQHIAIGSIFITLTETYPTLGDGLLKSYPKKGNAFDSPDNGGCQGNFAKLSNLRFYR